MLSINRVEIDKIPSQKIKTKEKAKPLRFSSNGKDVFIDYLTDPENEDIYRRIEIVASQTIYPTLNNSLDGELIAVRAAATPPVLYFFVYDMGEI